MKLKTLTLRRFRNVSECVFTPDAGLNFLIGQNGQGKTSFLEALGYLATLRSFRGSKSIETLQWGAESGEVSCLLSSCDDSNQTWNTDLKVVFTLSDNQRVTKTALINGKTFKSSTQYLSQRFGSYELGFHTVVFNPSDHDLVRGEPSVRRAYLDRVISANDVEYLKMIHKYARALEQRNAILKSAEKPDRELLLGFTEPLCEYGAWLTLKRLEWINALAPYLSNASRQIAPYQMSLRLVYLSNWAPFVDGLSLFNNDLASIHFTGHGALPSLELLEQAFWNKLSTLEAAEWRAGHSLVGPHRDDFGFFLGGQPLKGHGSQGEVRSALLALKLSEIELFRNATGHRPLFLLDDFSSELDRDRRGFLLRFLAETDLQTFVTTTEESHFVGKLYRVSNGNLTEQVETTADVSGSK